MTVVYHKFRDLSSDSDGISEIFSEVSAPSVVNFLLGNFNLSSAVAFIAGEVLDFASTLTLRTATLENFIGLHDGSLPQTSAVVKRLGWNSLKLSIFPVLFAFKVLINFLAVEFLLQSHEFIIQESGEFIVLAKILRRFGASGPIILRKSREYRILGRRLSVMVVGNIPVQRSREREPIGRIVQSSSILQDLNGSLHASILLQISGVVKRLSGKF